MSLFWDRRTHVVTKAFFDETNAAPEHWCELFLQWLEGIFLDTTVLRRDLPGPPVVPADYLFNAAFEPFEIAHDQSSDTVTIKDLVRDRVVIIGSAQKSAADFRDSPNAPQIPGALVHAVAVDNLLQFGVNYVKDQPLHAYIPSLGPIKRAENDSGDEASALSKALASLGAAPTSEIILILVLVVSALTYSVRVEDKWRSRGIEEFIKAHTKPFLKRFMIAIAVGIVAIALSAMGMMYLRLPPTQWFSTLLAFSFVGAPLGLAVANFLVMTVMYTKQEVLTVDHGTVLDPRAAGRPYHSPFHDRLKSSGLLRSFGSVRRKPSR